MALTRSIVELHHGTIDALSEGLGKGSEFVIKLPLAAVERHVEESLTAHRATVVSIARRKRVLVVDDNVDTATLLGALIKGMGHDVVTANSGPEALRVSENYRPHVVARHGWA